MEVLTGRSSFIPICVGGGMKKGFMGQQKLGSVWNKKSGLRGRNSAGKAKETASAFEVITGCSAGWADRRAVRERVRAQIIRTVWPVAKIVALIINVMESWYFKLGRVASLQCKLPICEVCREYDNTQGSTSHQCLVPSITHRPLDHRKSKRIPKKYLLLLHFLH